MENNSQQAWLTSLIKHLDSSDLEGYEIFYQKQKKFSVESRDFQTDTLQSSEDRSVAIRLLKDRRQGFSFATDLSESTLIDAANSALRIAKLREPEEFNLFAPVKSLMRAGTYTQFYDFESTDGPTPVTAAQKAKLARELEKAARSQDKRIRGARNAGFTDRSSETWIFRHDQKDGICFKKSAYTLSVSCLAEENGQSQLGGHGSTKLFFSQLPSIDEIAQKAAQESTLLLGATALKGSFQGSAVLRYDAVADLIEFMAPSFSAESLEKRRSLFEDKLNQKVFSPLFQLTDSPLHPDGIGSRDFDGEGVSAKDLVLIQDGSFKSFQSDFFTAQKMSLPHTGHSARGQTTPPKIGASNLVLRPGQDDLSKLFQKAKNGIFVTQLMGVHTANPVTGAFSLGAAGVKIENGELTSPVQGFAIAGNIFDLFLKIDSIGNDSEWSGSVLCPSILFDDMSVSGT